jgi:hypothetical protein
MPEKPDRSPDFVLSSWHFYFKEMLQWNANCNQTFYIEQRRENIVFYDESWDNWKRYDHHHVGDEGDAEKVYDAYISWQLENILLDRV